MVILLGFIFGNFITKGQNLNAPESQKLKTTNYDNSLHLQNLNPWKYLYKHTVKPVYLIKDTSLLVLSKDLCLRDTSILKTFSLDGVHYTDIQIFFFKWNSNMLIDIIRDTSINSMRKHTIIKYIVI